MNRARYRSYQDTGVEWLGDVPKHWKIKRLGSCFIQRNEKVSDKVFEPLSVTKNGVVPQLDTAAKTDDGDNRRRVCRGDFVINGRSDRKGSSGIAVQDGSVSLINIVLQPRSIHSKFTHYLLRSVPFQEEFYRHGKGIVADLWSTHFPDMKNIILALPPLEEQAIIANFLDGETAKIDALMGEQRQLIDLLKEKRQAVISSAVTKGLNPHVPMRDSDIEWLGKVPEHWKVMSIRRIATSIQTGGTPSSETPRTDLEGGIDWYTPGDFSDSLTLSKSSKQIDSSLVTSGESKLFPPGCVLIVSIGATLGKIGYIQKSASANQQINAVIPNNQIHGYFLAYSLLSKTEIMRFLSNASTIGIINQEKTKDIWLAVPPLKEQLIITNFLDRTTSGIDELISEAQIAIGLLSERRTVLISAAVTGKIDVRGRTGRESV